MRRTYLRLTLLLSCVERTARFRWIVGAGILALASPSFAREEDAQENDYDRAQMLLGRRNWAEAADVLKRLLKTTRGVPELTIDYARAIFYTGKREEAVSLLTAAVTRERGPARLELQRRAGVLARQFVTNSTFQLYQDGVNFLNARRLRDARDRLEKALATEPDNAEILTRLGQCLLLEGDYAGALGKLEAAKRLLPQEPEIRLWLGRAQHLKGNSIGGLEDLKFARQQLSGSEVAPVWFAEALAGSGQKLAAITLLDREVRGNPLHLSALLLLVRLKFQGIGRDALSLNGLRRDLQVLLSRLDDYATSGATAAESDLGLELRDVTLVRTEANTLFQRVEARLRQQEDAS